MEETEYKLLEESYNKINDNEITTTYVVIKTSNPYTHELARLKPFLTSYSRMQMAEIITDENILADVVRIHTDNICLTKPHDFTHYTYYPIEEKKTSGNIIWNSCNTYKKV